MGGSRSSGRPTAPSSPCERINFRAKIESPQPAILGPLTIGTELDVKIQAFPGTSVLVEYLGTAAGSLTGPKILELIGCINKGFEYSATIVAIDQGTYTVQVMPK